MTKQKGFTLVELIIVIVILGILAVTAAPKFLNIQGDAHKATLEGIEGSMKTVENLVYGKAIIQSKQTLANGTITKIEGANSIVATYGYPDEEWTNTWLKLLDISAELVTAGNPPAGTPDFVVTEGDASAATPTNAGTLKIYPVSYWGDGSATAIKDCYLEYDMDGTTATNTPTYAIVETDC